MESLSKTRDWLKSLQSERAFFRKGRAPSLEPTQEMLRLLGDPDRVCRHRVIVGGTAGKGSVCQYIENTLLEQKKSTLVLSSPHVYSLYERIRVDGGVVEEGVFWDAVGRIKKVADLNNIVLTYYEALVLAGIQIGAQQKNPPILIAEIGLGGALDAINAIKGPRISVLTFVGRDHLEIFDHSMEKLVTEKAGIFTPETVFAVSGERNKTHQTIIDKQSPVKVLYEKGLPEKMNKKLARSVITFLCPHTDFVMKKGTTLPGRWEKYHQNNTNFIFEGAHAPDRFAYIEPRVRRLKGPKALMFAQGASHHPEGLEKLLAFFDAVYWYQPPVKIASDFQSPQSLQSHFDRGQITDLSDPVSLEKFKNILVLGSFYTLKPIRDQLGLWPKT
jgi:folylpolyglutamate synthase/dihydropteroate synthase